MKRSDIPRLTDFSSPIQQQRIQSPPLRQTENSHWILIRRRSEPRSGGAAPDAFWSLASDRFIAWRKQDFGDGQGHALRAFTLIGCATRLPEEVDMKFIAATTILTALC